jgi:hypothetical protein
MRRGSIPSIAIAQTSGTFRSPHFQLTVMLKKNYCVK